MSELDVYRRQAIEAASQLCYPVRVQREICRAQSCAEISRIMMNARKGNLPKWAR